MSNHENCVPDWACQQRNLIEWMAMEFEGYARRCTRGMPLRVDRITPATTDLDRRAAYELIGWRDQCPVVTEPYTERIMAGGFLRGGLRGTKPARGSSTMLNRMRTQTVAAQRSPLTTRLRRRCPRAYYRSRVDRRSRVPGLGESMVGASYHDTSP